MSTIDVTEVTVIPPGAVAEHPQGACWAVDCDYRADPYFSSNSRMNLWAAPALITDVEPGTPAWQQIPKEEGEFWTGHGDTAMPWNARLVLTEDQITWIVLCGSTDWDNDGGWTPAHPDDPPPGHYNGNGCLDRWRDFPVAPIRFVED